MNVKVLIMAGGSGERFWPLSTKKKPKQLLSLVSNKTMIRETVDRILNITKIEDVYVATNAIQVTGIAKELPDLPQNNIIVEPSFRDTAAAVIYGSTYITKSCKNPTIIVLAADHLISDVDSFIKSLELAILEAKNNTIITLGIKPSRPETGYGYIELENGEVGNVTDTIRFLEKPDIAKAVEYLKNDNFVWNSGMFIFEYKTIYDEMRKYIPNHINIIEEMLPTILNNDGFELSSLVAKKFLEFDRISIDFAVMEKSKVIKCIPVDIGWNDIGGYNSLKDIFSNDIDNNSIKNAKYVYVDSSENIIISDDSTRLITSIGITNTIIVDTKIGLLICNRNDTQKIKELLKKIS